MGRAEDSRWRRTTELTAETADALCLHHAQQQEQWHKAKAAYMELDLPIPEAIGGVMRTGDLRRKGLKRVT